VFSAVCLASSYKLGGSCPIASATLLTTDGDRSSSAPENNKTTKPRFTTTTKNHQKTTLLVFKIFMRHLYPAFRLVIINPVSLR
jgi:hypothetical protein